MQKILPTSQAGHADQTITATVEYWDTPFSPLEGDEASGGILMDTFGAVPDASWSDLKDFVRLASGDFRAALLARPEVAVAVTNGRTDNLIGYWAGGAPAHHGVQSNGLVGYFFRGYLRSPTGRGWFDADPTPTFHLAVAGQGWVRIDKVVSGVRTTIFNAQVAEADYLQNGGFRVTPVITNMAEGDYFDICYIQDETDHWGGFVIKAVPGVPFNGIGERYKNLLPAREAPVLGCGLIDDGNTALRTPQVVQGYTTLEVAKQNMQSGQCTFSLPVVVKTRHDGRGWEFRKSGPDDAGTLHLWDGVQHVDPETSQLAWIPAFALKRQRLCRVTMGFPGEETVVFTGYIDDYDSIADGLADVRCLSFDGRLVQRFDKNFPDKISYMSHGYRRLTGTSEPSYDTPAFDNWPLEFAVGELLTRGGIDGSRLRRPLRVPLADGSDVPVAFEGEAHRLFRARTFSGKMLKLERAVHYGNNGVIFNEDKPADDPYIFAPENTKELWARALDLTDRYGYDLSFTEGGDVRLQPRNNPHRVYDLDPADITAGAAIKDIHPSAYAGLFLYAASGGLTVQRMVTGARIDLNVPVGPGLSDLQVTIARQSAPGVILNTVVLSPGATAEESYFYDFRSAVDGTNACVATLWSGDFTQYVVTITALEAKPVKLDTIFTYHTDPATPRLPVVLSTAQNALDVDTQGSMDEMRNFVTVVGRRRAALVDSDKPTASKHNPESEFVVARATDVASIVDPTVDNFIGYPREAIIYDANITDDDFAQYLARTFIYRYRVPKPAAPVRHTLLPVLQLRDPVHVRESRYETITESQVLWVTGYRHVLTVSEAGLSATTHVETTAYPEFPAFEPRQDIDIDLPEFGGRPIINIDVNYTSLSGHFRRNQTAESVYKHSDREIVGPLTCAISGTSITVNGPWPPVPGTFFIKADGVNLPTNGQEAEARQGEVRMYPGVSMPPIAVPGLQALKEVYAVEKFKDSFGRNRYGEWVLLTEDFRANKYGFYYTRDDLAQTVTIRRHPSAVRKWNESLRWEGVVRYYKGSTGPAAGWATNNPYHHFFNLDYRDGQTTVDLPWKQGNATAPYQLDPALDSLSVKYRSLLPFTGTTTTDPYPTAENIFGNTTRVSPFFDPYCSELGHLVHVKFDALISGLWRISVRAKHTGQVVAWLTEPDADATNAEAHWQWMAAGVGKHFVWDGVDQVGDYNAKQSAPFAAAADGEFEEEKAKPVGKGFYVWNVERKDGLPGQLALISSERNANGAPTFGVNTYGEFYIQIEATNDDLQDIADANPTVAAKQVPRTFGTWETNATPTGGTYPKLYAHSGTQGLIYTHLPDPTAVEIEAMDWLGASFDPDDLTAINDPENWGVPDATNAEAVIHNGKPTRIRFTPKARPGVLWAGKTDYIQFKLTRLVHLRATIHDQFLVWTGSNFAGTSVPDVTVVNRRVTNDSHTFRYEDTGYRTASSLKDDFRDGTEWIITPNDLKKAWDGTVEEPLKFGDYLQLEEVPKWDLDRQVGGSRARLQLAFLSYLFYISCFTSDRSGRRVWAMNPKFLDKSKLTTNDYGDWPHPSVGGVAATSATYRTPWPEDMNRMHRRTVFVRQWTSEPGWEAEQTARFGLSAVGQKLLRHYWHEHEPMGTSWAAYGLSEDKYGRVGKQLDALTLTAGVSGRDYSEDAVFRQLGDHGDTSSTNSLLGDWSWEAQPLWIPCITRDFHPYYLLPPMVSPMENNFTFYDELNGETTLPWLDYRRHYGYGIVDANKRNEEDGKNLGADAAAYETWHSAVYTMTQPYSAEGPTRFWPGTKIQKDQDPVKQPSDVHANYIRQDETVHYEDLRGSYSRGPRPGEAPKKITPVQPYYINPMDYDTLFVHKARNNAAYPRFEAVVYKWFTMKFRREYYWESGTMFPVNFYGRELLEAYNLEKAQLNVPALWSKVKYDTGAWTGWKDDRTDTTLMCGFNVGDGFATGYMPFGIGPRLPQTVDMYFHMVLVNERRETPLVLGS